MIWRLEEGQLHWERSSFREALLDYYGWETLVIQTEWALASGPHKEYLSRIPGGVEPRECPACNKVFVTAAGWPYKICQTCHSKLIVRSQ